MGASSEDVRGGPEGMMALPTLSLVAGMSCWWPS
jgi:hypothetical protein